MLKARKANRRDTIQNCTDGDVAKFGHRKRWGRKKHDGHRRH